MNVTTLIPRTPCVWSGSKPEPMLPFGGNDSASLDQSSLLTNTTQRATELAWRLTAPHAFERQFAELAQDPDAFHQLLGKAFGNYDREAAEALRQRALSGDFSWLPTVEFVPAGTLQGAHGAYDAEGGRVLLNSELISDPELLRATYAEEVGHHLDSLLNATDAPGDEGAIFRLLLSGQTLSATQLATLRAENDHATIVHDGRNVQVEFFLDTLLKAVVGNATSTAVGGSGSPSIIKTVVDTLAPTTAGAATITSILAPLKDAIVQLLVPSKERSDSDSQTAPPPAPSGTDTDIDFSGTFWERLIAIARRAAETTEARTEDDAD